MFTVHGTMMVPLSGCKARRNGGAGGRQYGGPRAASDVESEVHHIAVLDDVFLAFEAHLAGLL